MMDVAPKEWINEEQVKYFDLCEFVSKIKLKENVLYHMQDTSEEFEKYLKELAFFSEYDDYTMLYYWLDDAVKEIRSSIEIENNTYGNKELLKGDLFFDSLQVNHARLKRIHKFICDNSVVNSEHPGEYRKKDINVGAQINGKYQVYWYPPKNEDVKRFMDSYIQFYQTNSMKDTYNNPFIKSALAHLLFVRVHPFDDGNGRTSRILQNLCFTSSINKLYGTKLKLSPLNISQNIVRNRYSYVDKLNRIHFDMEHDNNDIINSWFDYILSMYDEQLFFQSTKLPSLKKFVESGERPLVENMEKIVKTSNIKKLKKL
jgi:fido (protein-threonine AMPylation protein)